MSYLDAARLPSALRARAADTSVDKTLRKLRAAKYPQYAIYLLVCLIVAAALCNAISILYNRITVRSAISGNANRRGEEDGPGSGTSRRNGYVSLRRVPVALVNTARILACRTSFPFMPGVRFTLIEVAVCALYLLAILVFEFANTRNVAGVMDPQYWANRAATIAISQLTVIVVLSGKNNIISALTGISYEKLNVFHRAVARTVLLLIWIHMWGRWKLGFTGNDSLHYGWVRSGIVANGALTLMVILGTRQIRNYAYEVFFAGHIVLSIILLVSACIHVTNARQFLPYVWAACIFWGLDRALRLARTLHNRHLSSGRNSESSHATLVVLSEDTVGVSLRISKSSRFAPSFGWRPGQNVYLSVPSVSRLGWGFSTEAHPFTIASIDSPITSSDGRETDHDQGQGTDLAMRFNIRVRHGFTRRLYERAIRAGGTCTVSAYVDGPYGDPPVVYGYRNVVLVAGGSGVSFTLPLLLDLVRRVRKDSPDTACQRIKFVWYIRERAHFECISADIRSIQNSLTNNLQIEIAVFVTGKPDPQSELDASSLHSSTEKQVDIEAEVIFGGPSAMASKERLESETPTPAFEEASSRDNAATNRIVNLKYGRPVIADILKNEISMCTDSVAVCVSGPQSLIDDVRAALSRPSIANPMSVLRGGPSVFLHVEHFGM